MGNRQLRRQRLRYLLENEALLPENRWRRRAVAIWIALSTTANALALAYIVTRD